VTVAVPGVGESDTDGVRECVGVGDGDAGDDMEGEAECGGAGLADSDGHTGTGGRAEGSGLARTVLLVPAWVPGPSGPGTIESATRLPRNRSAGYAPHMTSATGPAAAQIDAGKAVLASVVRRAGYAALSRGGLGRAQGLAWRYWVSWPAVSVAFVQGAGRVRQDAGQQPGRVRITCQESTRGTRRAPRCPSRATSASRSSVWISKCTRAVPSPRRWVSSQRSWPCSAPWYSGWLPNGCSLFAFADYAICACHGSRHNDPPTVQSGRILTHRPRTSPSH
jgi:hypothetical protein